MKFILFLLAYVIVTVSAGLGGTVSDFMSTFKDATKDHVSSGVIEHLHARLWPIDADFGNMGSKLDKY